MDKEKYEEELKKKQEEHLKHIQNNQYWSPCLHDSCPECIGTGIKKNGSMCVHMLSCLCPKCSTYC